MTKRERQSAGDGNFRAGEPAILNFEKKIEERASIRARVQKFFLQSQARRECPVRVR